MNGNTCKALERCVGYCCAATICCYALHVDGVQAITMAIGVAGAIGAGATYVAMKK